MSDPTEKGVDVGPSNTKASVHAVIPKIAPDRWMIFAVCLGLAMLTWVVFGQTLRHEFINLDDNDYVYENFNVARGLTLKSIAWAFTHVHSGNWHPLTTISHM